MYHILFALPFRGSQCSLFLFWGKMTKKAFWVFWRYAIFNTLYKLWHIVWSRLKVLSSVSVICRRILHGYYILLLLLFDGFLFLVLPSCAWNRSVRLVLHTKTVLFTVHHHNMSEWTSMSVVLSMRHICYVSMKLKVLSCNWIGIW